MGRVGRSVLGGIGESLVGDLLILMVCGTFVGLKRLVGRSDGLVVQMSLSDGVGSSQILVLKPSVYCTVLFE